MPRTPVRCTVRQALQGPDDHRLDAGVVHLARRTRARLVPQTLLPIGQEASAPLAHRRRIDVELRSDLLVGGPITGQKHDPRPHRQGLRRLAPRCQGAQLRTLRLAQNQRLERTAHHNLRLSDPANVLQRTSGSEH